jgi:hypothetical protein
MSGTLKVPDGHDYAVLNGSPVELHDTWPDRLLLKLLESKRGFAKGDILHVPHGSLVEDAKP